MSVEEKPPVANLKGCFLSSINHEELFSRLYNTATAVHWLKEPKRPDYACRGAGVQGSSYILVSLPKYDSCMRIYSSPKVAT